VCLLFERLELKCNFVLQFIDSNCTGALVCLLFERLKQSRWALWNIPTYSVRFKFVNGYHKHYTQKFLVRKIQAYQMVRKKLKYENS
jgi:hypothetical protein